MWFHAQLSVYFYTANGCSLGKYANYSNISASPTSPVRSQSLPPNYYLCIPIKLPLQLPLLNYHLSITAYYSQTPEVNCQCHQTLRSNEVFISTLPHDRLHGPPCVSFFLSFSQLNPKTEALMKSIKTSSTTHELYTFAIMVC